MSPDTLATTLRDAGLDPKRDHPVARLGFWRLGGPADVFGDISTPAQLATVMTLRVPVTVIGKGSNLLVADAGIRGLTIRLVGDFRQVQLGEDADHGPVADVGGGVMNTVLLKRLADAKRGGAATLAGVPGTMGGAILDMQKSLADRDAKIDELHARMGVVEAAPVAPRAVTATVKQIAQRDLNKSITGAEDDLSKSQVKAALMAMTSNAAARGDENAVRGFATATAKYEQTGQIAPNLLQAVRQHVAS